MKKSTLTAIMQGVMIVLVIAIIVVSIKLILRPEAEPPSEQPIVETPIESESDTEIVSEEPEEVKTYTRVRIKTDNINVRSGPGTDYERLGSAYNGYDFEFVEVVNDEWTKIIYDDKEAYVFSEYVEIVEMYLNVDGKYIDVPEQQSGMLSESFSETSSEELLE